MIKYFKLLICLALIFIINNKADALSGVGPLKFNNQIYDLFLAYLRGDGQTTGEVGFKKGTPGSFAVNPEGTEAFYTYCPVRYSGCRPTLGKTVQRCSKRSKAIGGSKCKLFAKGKKIVWDGKNIKFSGKFDAQVVRAVFKENGWYEDFSNRPAPSGTGENKYIQKKKNKNKSKIVKKEKSKNIVSELQELKRLLDEGILTEDEFKNAKKKLLD